MIVEVKEKSKHELLAIPKCRFQKCFETFKKRFMAILFTLKVFARNLLRGSCRRNIFHISFWMTDLGYEPQAFVSNKPTHYILKHGDKIVIDK